ncbi:hypothetical protein BGZ83_003016 [Gryganskiella cystojenkinii]|nr:hypothetical protein BGZ83_003016 [Gryganskiella cystojenkinii]
MSNPSSSRSSYVLRSILPLIQPQSSSNPVIEGFTSAGSSLAANPSSTLQTLEPSFVGSPQNGSSSNSTASSSLSTKTASKSHNKKAGSSARRLEQTTHTPAPSTSRLDQPAVDAEVVGQIEKQGGFWNSEGTRAVVDWISNPQNYCRLINPRPVSGSRVQDIHQEIVNWIKEKQGLDLGTSQVKSKIGYIKRKYHEALVLNSPEAGDNILERQEDLCPPFQRLHAVFSSSLSLNPPQGRTTEVAPNRSAIVDLVDVEELDTPIAAGPKVVCLILAQQLTYCENSLVNKRGRTVTL